MQEDDEKQRKRWTDKTVALLKAAEAPSVLQAMNSSDPDLAMGSLVGRARPKTIQLRVRSWAALVRWLEWRYGCKWPRSAHDLVDYILEMLREGAVASFPRTLSAALTWFEARSGRPSDMKYPDNDLLRRTLENVELLVNSGTAPVKKALRFPISVIAALELAVAAEDRNPVGARVSAWARLLKINGSLSMDDLQRIHPENVTMGDAGLTGRMMRTKCSGTGKKVRELPLFMPRALGLVRRDWLRIGYKLWREAASFARDYFLPRISSDYATFIPKLASWLG